MNTKSAREQYWSDKLGFPVKDFDAVVPTTGSGNPLVDQYLRDKYGTN